MTRQPASERGEPLATITVTRPARALRQPLPTVVGRLRVQLRLALAWTVWQPNSAALWGAVRQQIEDIVFVCWRDGDLVGTTAEQAFFVRCDQTTMTQNDIDNGRLIAVVGVATVKPAEFMILRITQQVGQPEEAPTRRLFPRAPLR